MSGEADVSKFAKGEWISYWANGNGALEEAIYSGRIIRYMGDGEYEALIDGSKYYIRESQIISPDEE